MTVKERIFNILLQEKIKENPEYAKKIKIEAISRKTNKIENLQNKDTKGE